MTEEKWKALEDLLNERPELAREIFAMEAPNAAKALTELGVEVTAEDLAGLTDFADIPQGELNEDTLDSVSGGSIWWIYNEIKKKRGRKHGGGGRSF